MGVRRINFEGVVFKAPDGFLFIGSRVFVSPGAAEYLVPRIYLMRSLSIRRSFRCPLFLGLPVSRTRGK